MTQQKYIIIIIFTFLALINLPLIAEDEFNHIVVQTSADGHWITLSDTSVWEVLSDFNKTKNWKPGDSVTLNVNFYFLSHEYFLKNQTIHEEIHIQNFCQEPPNALALRRIEAVSHNCKYLRLDDNSIWKIEMNWLDTWRRTIYWKEGEQVSVFKTTTPDNYFLINQNHSPHFNTFSAELHTHHRQNIPYRHFIADIINDGAIIKLKNGYSWNVPKVGWWMDEFTFDHDKMRKEVRNWKAGDEILMGWNDVGDKKITILFWMINLRTLTRVKVEYPMQHQTEVYLRITEIDPKGYSFSLDDGSKWNVSYIDSWQIWHWNADDRVLVFNSHLKEHQRHMLLNLDQHHYIAPGWATEAKD